MATDTLADAVVVMHFAFIAFVVGGALLALRWPRVLWLHLPALAWGASTEFFGIVCPLTYLENYLRARGASGAYRLSFIEEYLVPIVYPAALTSTTQWLLGAALVATNGAMYIYLWRRGVIHKALCLSGAAR